MYKFQQSLGATDEFHKDIVSSEINLNKVRNVLDIGCGIGADSDLFNNQSTNYLGIDLDARRIEFANQTFGTVNKSFKQMSLNDLSIKEVYDLVLIFGVFHHLSDFEIENFLLKIKSNSNFFKKIILLDPVKLPNQKNITKFLHFLDIGGNIKTEKEYLIPFKGYKFIHKIVNSKKMSFMPFIKTVIDI